MERVSVLVRATDALSHAGFASYLSSRPEITVVNNPDGKVTEGAQVVVFVVERLSSDVLRRLRESASAGLPTVLLTNELAADAPLLTLVEYRVVAILPKPGTTGDQLVDTVLSAAAGGGTLPRSVLGQLFKQVDSLQRNVLAPHGLHVSGLDQREIEVLRLIAEGWDTEEIAAELRYSARTVKGVIYNMTSRLKLRNRAHAVAYALRAGVI